MLQKKRLDTFYAEKYIAAYPQLLASIDSSPFAAQKAQAFSCYSIRTFSRFLEYFGLIKMTKKKNWADYVYITKTALFDQLIKVKSPKRMR